MRRIAALTLTSASIALVFIYAHRYLLGRLARHNPTVLFYAPTLKKSVALTIDDVPHPAVTPAILDILAANHARATFFVIGEQVVGNEALIQRIVEDGHELGNHLMSDLPSIELAASEFASQLEMAHELISQFGPVHWCRPGSAWFNERMLRQFEAHGYSCVLGSVYPADAQIPFVPFLVSYILLMTFPGSIIVLHDGRLERKRTVHVLRWIIPALQRRGYSFVTLSELVAEEDGYSNT